MYEYSQSLLQFQSIKKVSISIVLAVLVAVLPACQSKKKAEYGKPLPPGAYALRKLDPADWPDLSYVTSMDADFIAALKRSLAWFDKPSTKQFYPSNGISHQQAQATLYALPNLAWENKTNAAFLAKLKEECELYTSVGWDDFGTVLFTGYYTPVLPASRVKTARFQFPLYGRPADLVANPVTGDVKGRRVGDKIVAYPNRAAIEQSRMLAGSELVWLESRLEAYLVEVQGSAKFTLPDGQSMLVGFAGSNGAEYKSIRNLLIADGKLDKDTANLPAIKTYFRDNPESVNKYIRQNDRFIFFAEYPDETNWPAGSLGFKVQGNRSIATDNTVFPRGCVCIAMTDIGKTQSKANSGSSGAFSFLKRIKDATRGKAHQRGTFNQWMLDQDTGGAIRAAGRADLYFGVGKGPEEKAGNQIAEGRLYYLFLKPERIQFWVDRMHATPK